ncbi:response regulator [bacterium]|nr:MAG: response regulator [bacterium]
MDGKIKESKVLILDDDKSVRNFLEKFLKQKGYVWVRSVNTGNEAIDIIGKEDIKLVLLDIKMPGMDGIEVLRKIKEIKKDIEVIMITGFPEENTAKEALKLGAYDYIMKPFDLAYLELCVFTKIAAKEPLR